VLFSMWQRLELRRYGYQMEPAQRELAEEREIERHLRLEIESLRSLERIELRATRDLQMVAPGPGDFETIQRVLPAAVPPGSVVARR
jgi:hypothetical protein